MASAEDLSPQAVKLARRIQTLRPETLYTLRLIKLREMWVLSLEDDKATKVEILK